MELLTTSGTYQVSLWNCHPGPWYPASRGNFWYIINIDTHRKKKMGPFRWSGVNHFDRSVEEANRRNRPTTEALCPKCGIVEMDSLGKDPEGYEICSECRHRVTLQRKEK